MSDYIVSCDAGNGGVNAVLSKGNGRCASVYFPSVRAAATGDSLGLGQDFELAYDYVDWYGHRYVVGEDALRVTRRHMERHTGANRYGNELHQFLVAVALARLGVTKGSVALTLFAPPGLYLQARQTMLQRFAGAEVTIRLKSDRKPRVWRYASVTVWPEGLGAAACFLLDDEGRPTATDVLSGDTLILDLGFYTLDALKMVDGSFNPEELEHATFENGGVHTHILEPILRTLRRMGDDFQLLTADDVDRVLRRGLVSGDYTLTAAGHAVDIQPLVEKHRERYAGWVANTLVDGVFAGLRGIKSVILVGGGATLVEDHMITWYGSKVLDRRQHPTARRVHPVDFNAVGGLRLALMGRTAG